MKKIIKLTNGRFVEADYSISNKKAYGHLQVLDIKDEGGWVSKSFTIFEDPSKRYFIDDMPRKTKKNIEILNQKFINTLDSVLMPFLADNNLTIASE